MLALLLPAIVHAATPIAVLHVDPGASATVGLAIPAADLTAKIDFPIALFLCVQPRPGGGWEGPLARRRRSVRHPRLGVRRRRGVGPAPR